MLDLCPFVFGTGRAIAPDVCSLGETDVPPFLTGREAESCTWTLYGVDQSPDTSRWFVWVDGQRRGDHPPAAVSHSTIRVVIVQYGTESNRRQFCAACLFAMSE